MKEVSNWGNFPKVNAAFIEPSFVSELSGCLQDNGQVIARGNGRCYGDSALSTKIVSSLRLNRFISFDKQNGILECEAGILLSEVLTVIVPQGYFLPVTPGTKLITVGGAIAADIHGKNHHKEGCFGHYVHSFKLIDNTGTIKECSRTQNHELFKQTVGGMGLTGIIVSARFSLKRIETSFIKQKSQKASCLEDAMKIFEDTAGYTYSVAWVDCLASGNKLGRSLVMAGEHAAINDLPDSKKDKPLVLHNEPKLNFPFYTPAWLLNKYSIQAFNFLYYNKQFSQTTDTVIHYDPYFYPLDAINNWNKLYGTPGFTQYQFVIPFESSKSGLKEIFKLIAKSGEGSFLAVLKTMGASNPNSIMSFPFPGYTLALDFKVSEKVFKLLNELDKIVEEHQGRLYLAKDARMSSAFFKRTYKAHYITAQGKFRSVQSNRLEI